jgi:hypothetical protein
MTIVIDSSAIVTLIKVELLLIGLVVVALLITKWLENND